jgi:hypothetical protein
MQNTNEKISQIINMQQILLSNIESITQLSVQIINKINDTTPNEGGGKKLLNNNKKRSEKPPVSRSRQT